MATSQIQIWSRNIQIAFKAFKFELYFINVGFYCDCVPLLCLKVMPWKWANACFIMLSSKFSSSKAHKFFSFDFEFEVYLLGGSMTFFFHLSLSFEVMSLKDTQWSIRKIQKIIFQNGLMAYWATSKDDLLKVVIGLL
jgi:hypothetical protein